MNSNNSLINSTSAPSDLTNPSLRYSTSILGNTVSGSRNSPSTDSLPGPSGIGPVQILPLVWVTHLIYLYSFINNSNFLSQSLKKEADWDRSDDKDSSDYRHQHDMVSKEFSLFPCFFTLSILNTFCIKFLTRKKLWENDIKKCMKYLGWVLYAFSLKIYLHFFADLWIFQKKNENLNTKSFRWGFTPTVSRTSGGHPMQINEYKLISWKK